MKRVCVGRTNTERWLVMALLLVGLMSCATSIARADDWSKTYILTGQPDLRIETSDANIHVSTWEQNTIEAKVTTKGYKIGDSGIKIEEYQSGDKVEIEVRYPHHNFEAGWNNMSHRVDVSIRMPREGRMDVHTSDGKIEVGNFKGEMQFRSDDGSEEIENVDGKLYATSGDGHIRATGRFDELELKTGDGRVDARAASGSSLATAWRLESGDGSVTLEVPENLTADVDLQTGDGHIDLDIPVTTEGKIGENEVRGKLNGGGKPLVIHTGDGSIRLRKG